MKPHNVIFIDDDPDKRQIIGEDLLTVGLSNDVVDVQVKPNFTGMKEELDQGIIASVYILDENVGNNQGSQWAKKILDAAQKLGIKTKIIILSGEPREASSGLYDLGIDLSVVPCLDKETQSVLCGLYVGWLLHTHDQQDKNLTYNNWLLQEGINLPWGTRNVDFRINNALRRVVEPPEKKELIGGLYSTPYDIAAKAIDDLNKRILSPSTYEAREFTTTISGLEQMFLPKKNSLERQ